MTELSFLLELIFNHKLPKATQQVIKDRIAEIQLPAIQSAMNSESATTYTIRPSELTDEQILAAIPPNKLIQIPEKIAQTPAAQEALNTRQAMINAAMTRKVMPGSDHAPKSHGKV